MTRAFVPEIIQGFSEQLVWISQIMVRTWLQRVLRLTISRSKKKKKSEGSISLTKRNETKMVMAT